MKEPQTETVEKVIPLELGAYELAYVLDALALARHGCDPAWDEAGEDLVGYLEDALYRHEATAPGPRPSILRRTPPSRPGRSKTDDAATPAPTTDDGGLEEACARFPVGTYALSTGQHFRDLVWVVDGVARVAEQDEGVVETPVRVFVHAAGQPDYLNAIAPDRLRPVPPSRGVRVGTHPSKEDDT